MRAGAASRERWFRIVHFINSLDRRYKVNKRVGWVYIMRNPAFKDPILKIGKSQRPPWLRAAELGGQTGVPGGFELLYFVHACDCHQAERLVHQLLAKYRQTAAKEFFDVTIAEAIEALDHAAEHFPIRYHDGGRVCCLPQYFDPVLVRCPDCETRNSVKPLLVPLRVGCRVCGRGLGVG